jgi:diadenosine tetraphosphatase ApaH/serine/threonine PP2A family protein phosphatase
VYLPIKPQRSNARAWLAAAEAVKAAGGEAHNVIIDIADPLAADETDLGIMATVDRFLRDHHRNTLLGVANTIFPQSTLDRHGPEAFYGVYHERVLPRMKSMTRDWGRYFERLTRWKKVKGAKVEVINPLDDLVHFMREQVAGERTYRNAYEMTIYDPARDAGKVANRQCLSFLSFKLNDQNELLLTVMYRNHAYIARGLGNFVGLGRLQAFVADQAGAKLGSLTCVSTHAEIDFGKAQKNGVTEGWSKVEADALVDACKAALMREAA